MCRVGPLLLLLLLSPDIVKACNMEDIAEMLIQQTAWNFEQEKTVSALSRTLHSEGQFWLQNEENLVWQLDHPVRAVTVISSSGVRQYNSAGEIRMEDSNPVLNELSRVLLSLLKGNFESLQQVFDISLACADDGVYWEMELRPTGEQMVSLLSSIRLSGADSIEVLSFVEARGDATRLRLSPAEQMPEPHVEFQ